jgi:hypothetical protein
VFGEKIWWNHLRPIHSFLYFLFAYNARKENKFVDVMLGLLSFLIFHFYNNDLPKVFN